jgi:DNA-directed RNA polymerase subunit RPC12/RpoP
MWISYTSKICGQTFIKGGNMKFLKCAICKAEIDLLKDDRSSNKKIRCRKCGHTNENEAKGPEIVIIRRRPADLD